jgi:hypothetical protein
VRQRRLGINAARQKEEADNEALFQAQKAHLAEQTKLTRFDLRTRQRAADIHRNATGMDSDEFISRSAALTVRGRELEKQVAMAPIAVAEQTRAVAVAELEAVRSDMTRVGGRTWAKNFEPGFQSIEQLHHVGGAAEELRKMGAQLDQLIAAVKATPVARIGE